MSGVIRLQNDNAQLHYVSYSLNSLEGSAGGY